MTIVTLDHSRISMLKKFVVISFAHFVQIEVVCTHWKVLLQVASAPDRDCSI